MGWGASGAVGTFAFVLKGYRRDPTVESTAVVKYAAGNHFYVISRFFKVCQKFVDKVC